jgi:hypothetical protein
MGCDLRHRSFVTFITVVRVVSGYIVLTKTLTRRLIVTKSPIILSSVLAAALFVLPSAGASAGPAQICKPTTMEKRMCDVRGGKWNKLTCDCVLGGSAAAISISTNSGIPGGTPGAGNPEDPGTPGNPGGNPEGTEQASSGAGNPGNGKSVGNAGEKGKDNENPSSGTHGSGNDPGKGGKGKGKNKD